TIAYPTELTTKEYSTNGGSTWTTYSAAITMSANGTVLARGNDVAGNQAMQASLTVSNIDKTSPTVVFGTNGGNNVPSASTIVTVSDLGGSSLNTSSLQYVWDTQNVTTPSSGWVSFSNGSTIARNGDGSYYLWVKANDNAGNNITTKTNVFVIVTQGNYGTSIQSSYTNIYSKSGGLISANPYHTYNYGNYAKLYVALDYFGSSSSLFTAQSSGFAYLYSGTNTYNFTRVTNTNRWINIYFRAGGMTTGVYLGNMKLVFNDNASYTFTQAVSNGYIEPLVMINCGTGSTSYRWTNMYNMLSGGNCDSGNFPEGQLLFKVKNVPLKGFSIYSNVTFNTTYDGWRAYEAPITTDYSITSF
ncbi:MAG: hypothetical protein N2749_05180, partial [Clostridia bacterium]|nr:hypothetical protein [Clostridia bacterium]